MIPSARLVQDVEIAEALLGQYLASLAQTTQGLTLRLDQQAAIGAAEQVYPEVWKRLDSARSTASQSGRDLSYYDALRSYIGHDAQRGITKRTTEVSALLVGVLPIAGAVSVTAEGNTEGVRAARDAIATFRQVFPDAPWQAPQTEPVPDLRTGTGKAKLIAVVGATVIVAVVLAFYLGLI